MTYPTGAIKSWQEAFELLGDEEQITMYRVHWEGDALQKRHFRLQKRHFRKISPHMIRIDGSTALIDNEKWYDDPGIGFVFCNYWFAHAYLQRLRRER